MTNDTGLVERVNSGRNVADILNEMERERFQAASRIEALEAEVERFAWQPIETAPKDTLVLLYGEPCGEIFGRFREPTIVVGANRYDYWAVDATDYYQVTVEPTHWMPLPNPPSQEGTG